VRGAAATDGFRPEVGWRRRSRWFHLGVSAVLMTQNPLPLPEYRPRVGSYDYLYTDWPAKSRTVKVRQGRGLKRVILTLTTRPRSKHSAFGVRHLENVRRNWLQGAWESDRFKIVDGSRECKVRTPLFSLLLSSSQLAIDLRPMLDAVNADKRLRVIDPV